MIDFVRSIYWIFGLCPHEWHTRDVIGMNEQGDWVCVEVAFCTVHGCSKRKVHKVYLR